MCACDKSTMRIVMEKMGQEEEELEVITHFDY